MIKKMKKIRNVAAVIVVIVVLRSAELGLLLFWF